MPRRAAAFLAAALLALSGGMPPARAQSPDENVQFGQGLVKRGYYDLAREFLEKQREQASKEPEKIAYELALLSIVSDEIDRAPIDQRDEMVVKAVDAYQKFLAKAGTIPEAAQAKFDVGELLSRKGRILTEQAKRENRKELFGDADKAFQAAEAYLRGIFEQYAKEMEDLQKKDSRAPGISETEKKRLAFVVEKRMLARYYLIIALYDHGEALEGRETGAGKDTFKMLAKQAKEFLWDYEGFVVAFDVALYLGRGLAAIDDYEQAIPFFEQAYSIVSSEAGKQYADIAKRAYYYKAQALIGRAEKTKEKKYNEEAIRVIDKLGQAFPGFKDEDLGKAAEIERANALYGLGQKEKAQQIWNGFIAQGGSWAYRVQRRIQEITGAGGTASAAISLEFRVAAADSLVTEQKYREAVRQYRAIIRDARTAKDLNEIVPTCWHKIGMCYIFDDRYDEAMIAFEALEKYGSHPKAEDAAFERVRAASLQRKYAEDSGNPAELKAADEQIQAAMDRFIKLYPNSPKALDFVYLRAVAEEKKGNFEKAADLYAQVPKTASSYEKALASIGYCLFKQADKKWEDYRKERKAIMDRLAGERSRAGQPALKEDELEKIADQGLKAKRGDAMRLFEQAEAKLREFNELGTRQLKDPSLDPKVLDNRRVALLAARYYLSRVYLHEALRKPQGVLDVLANVEKDFGDAKFDSQVALILESRLKAALELGKVDDARATFDLISSRYKVAGDAAITRTSEDLAWAYDKQAVALEAEIKKHDEEGAPAQKLAALRKAEKPDPAAIAAAEKELADHKAQVEPRRQEMLRLRRESAEFFSAWLKRRIDAGLRVKAADLDAVGNMLVDFAEKAPTAPERAQYYEKALYLFQLLWTQIDQYQKGESRTPPAGLSPEDFWKTAWRMAKCNVAAGKFDEAIRAYDALLRDDRLKSMGFLYEEKADAHIRAGDELWDKERKKATEQYEAARKIYGQLILKVDPIATPPPPKEALRAYWNSNLSYIRLYMKMNEAERASEYIKRQKHLYPKLDNNEYGYLTAIEAIEKELEAKLPKTKKP